MEERLAGELRTCVGSARLEHGAILLLHNMYVRIILLASNRNTNHNNLGEKVT